MGHAILEISIFKNWIGLETAELRLLTLHVYLKLGFTAGHPVTLDDGRLLGIPATAAGLLANRRGMPKGISG
jgi:hypothetical protein